jgi:hypothetical protein
MAKDKDFVFQTLQSKTISSKSLQLQKTQANPCNYITNKHLAVQNNFKQTPCSYNNFKQTPATTLQTRTLQSQTISSKPLQLHKSQVN